jgi:hypothetical protein
MDKYYFLEDVWETPTKCNGNKKVIRYKCLICGYQHDYDATWTDEKKAEVQAEVDAHHNDHINFEKV